MWLIVTDSADQVGPWLATGLRERGLEPVELVTLGELLVDTTWVHTVGAEGASFVAELPGGRRIDSRHITGAINRISHIPPQALPLSDPDDREYANAEQHAFFLSWLASIRAPVLNPPAPRGLGGSWRPPSEWFWLAHQAGLPCEPFRMSSRQPGDGAWRPPPWTGPSAITVGTEMVDTGITDELRQGCINLAFLSNTPLLGVQFRHHRDGTLLFAGANPRPQLELAGTAVIDALAYVLKAKEAA